MSSTTTRRGLLGGAAGAGAFAAAGPVLGAKAPSETVCVPSPPGFPTGAIALAPGGTVWTTDPRSTTITSHRGRSLKRGRSIEVGGAPVGIDISPDGRLALVTTAYYDRPGLSLVELPSGKVERLDVGPEPGAVAFSPDGREAFVVSGGPEGTLTLVDTKSARVHAPIPIGKHPRGLAVAPDGKQVLVALNGAGALALITIGKKTRVQRIHTPPFPREVAVAPDGSRAIVTHNGYGARTATIVDLAKRRTIRKVRIGKDPAGVAFGLSGSRMIVAAGSGTAVVLDAQGKPRREAKLGGHPHAVAVVGSTAYVADSQSGRVRRVRLGSSG